MDLKHRGDSETESSTACSSSYGYDEPRPSSGERAQEVEMLMQSLNDCFADEGVPVAKLESFVCDLLDTRKACKTIDPAALARKSNLPLRADSIESFTSWESWGTPFEEIDPLSAEQVADTPVRESSQRRRSTNQNGSRRRERSPSRSASRRTVRNRSVSPRRRTAQHTTAAPSQGSRRASETVNTTYQRSMSMKPQRSPPSALSSRRKSNNGSESPRKNVAERRRLSQSPSKRRVSSSPTKERQTPLKGERSPRRRPRVNMERAVSARLPMADEEPVVFNIPTEEQSVSEESVIRELERLRNKVQRKKETIRAPLPSILKSPRSVTFGCTTPSSGRERRTVSAARREELRRAIRNIDDASASEQYSASATKQAPPMQQLYASPRAFQQEFVVSPRSQRPALKTGSSDRHLRRKKDSSATVMEPSTPGQKSKRPQLLRKCSSERDIDYMKSVISNEFAAPRTRTPRSKKQSIMSKAQSERKFQMASQHSEVSSPRQATRHPKQSLKKLFSSSRVFKPMVPSSNRSSKTEASKERSPVPLKSFISESQISNSGGGSIYSNDTSQTSAASTVKAGSQRRRRRTSRVTQEMLDCCLEDSSESSFDVVTPRSSISTMTKPRSKQQKRPVQQHLTRTSSYTFRNRREASPNAYSPFVKSATRPANKKKVSPKSLPFCQL